MMALAALAGACGGLAVFGTVALLRAALPARPPRRPLRLRLPSEQLTLALAAGLAVLVLTRWPVAAVAATVGAFFVPVTAAQRSRRSHAQRTEALATWTAMLRDGLSTANQLEGVLVTTAPAAPAAIREPVAALATSLSDTPLEVALDRLAVELDHHVGDVVVTALRLGATAGAEDLPQVLDDLAAAARDEADSARRTDDARQGPRSALRYTAAASVGVVVVLLAFSPTYFRPYQTAEGQGVLALVGLWWAWGFWLMARMGRIPPVPRFLARGVRS